MYIFYSVPFNSIKEERSSKMYVTKESSKATSWGVITELTVVIQKALAEIKVDLLRGEGYLPNDTHGHGERNELYLNMKENRITPYGDKVLWVSYEPTEPSSDTPVLSVKVTVQELALSKSLGRKKMTNVLNIISSAIKDELSEPTGKNISRVHPTSVRIGFAGIHVLI